MSKILYVLKNNAAINELDIRKLDLISENLIPDNISSNDVKNRLYVDGNFAYTVINDSGVFPTTDNGVLCGTAILSEGWDSVGSDLPPGDYAVFRINNDFFELSANTVGSRTVWYFKDHDYFIASTSQRAIIMYIGEFKFNKKVIPWVLSTGTIGPSDSWDSRIKRLQPSSSVLLNIKLWEEIIENNECLFNVADDGDDIEKCLRDEIKNAINVQGKSINGWVLPLSGGYDSRGILCHMLLNQDDSIDTITWGVQEEENRKYGDADIAKRLADNLGVKHKYVLTNTGDESIEKVLERYLHCSEGRIDHFSGYADGMKIWSDLHASGIKGIIRGDEGFGWVSVSSEKQVRIFNGIGLCSDYENLKNLHEIYNLEPQNIPCSLKKSESESLEVWRDRIYHGFRIPTVLAALSDIKLSYVEQSNPLLYDNIINIVRSMPDNLREEKFLFRKIVDDISPDIEYAKFGANAGLANIFSRSDVVSEIRTTLMNDFPEEVLPKKFRLDIVSNIVGRSKTSVYKSNIIDLIKKSMPNKLKTVIKKNEIQKSYKVDPYILSFRAYILVKMHGLLTKDSNIMRNTTKD
ncbi:asparagine synthase-related protein [Vibrio sp. 10N.261.55.F4]|uniref:asparagine synthase-related protein n=1 Tax=Vibrio sp. 10N.261.55.F4 TaxID=3229692 RepID=UPI00354B06A2